MDVIDLSPGWDEVFAHGFSRSARYNVRKAERAGVDEGAIARVIIAQAAGPDAV